MKYEKASFSTQFLRTLAKSPDVLAGMARAAVRKRVTSQFDYYVRQDGHSMPFTQVNIKITNACNLRCKMCGQWGENGWHILQPSSFQSYTVPLDTYKQMVDELVPFSPWIVISGGESTLYRDLLKLTRHITESGLLCTLVTNGMNLEGIAEELVDQGLAYIMTSIDGPRETHDQIRGVKGAFDRTVAGLAAVEKAKRTRNVVKPLTVVLTTVSVGNTANLDQGAWEVAENVGADGVLAYWAYFQTDESCEAHAKLMLEELDTVANSPSGFKWSHEKVDTHQLVDTVHRIRSKNWSFPYVFAPKLTDEEVHRWYRADEQSNSFGYKKCVAPWTMVEIMPNGDVTPCRDYPDYITGNIKERSLMDIWNGERYKKFRNVLRENTLLPICSRCCGMMDW